MMHAAKEQFSSFPKCSTGTAIPALQCLSANQSSKSLPVMPTNLEGQTDMRANGYSDRSIIGHRRNKSCMADEKNANQDWLAAKIAGYSVADVVGATGMSETAVQNIRRGKAKMSFDNMTSMFKAHPELGAEYMEYIGVLLPGQAETAAAYTRFANAAVRGRG